MPMRQTQPARAAYLVWGLATSHHIIPPWRQMRPWELGVSIAGLHRGPRRWASLGGEAGRRGSGQLAFYSLFGGAAAFGLAVIAYDLASSGGYAVEWERLVRGDLAGAAALAIAIGARRGGGEARRVLLVVERGWRTPAVLGASVGVSAGFAALEAFTTLQGFGSPLALARVALGPAAHAMLALPLALGVASAARGERHAWRTIAGGLAASVGAARRRRSRASPGAPAGQLGYALALLAAPLWLFLRARARGARRRAAPGAVAARHAPAATYAATSRQTCSNCARSKPLPLVSQSKCGGTRVGRWKWPITSRWSAHAAWTTSPQTWLSVGTIPSFARTSVRQP